MAEVRQVGIGVVFYFLNLKKKHLIKNDLIKNNY